MSRANNAFEVSEECGPAFGTPGDPRLFTRKLSAFDPQRRAALRAQYIGFDAVVEAQRLNLHNMGGTEFDKICEVIRCVACGDAKPTPSDHDSRRSAPDVFGSARWNAGPIVCLYWFRHCLLWTEERSQKEFGARDYRVGWYLLDDDAIEFDDPMGWQPLIHELI
jgi:hypothetical protein